MSDGSRRRPSSSTKSVKTGTRIPSSFDAEERVYAALQTGLMRSNMPAEFAKALAAYVRAYLTRDNETLEAVAGWLRGVKTPVRLPGAYVQRPRLGGGSPKGTFLELKPIGTGNARDIMR